MRISTGLESDYHMSRQFKPKLAEPVFSDSDESDVDIETLVSINVGQSAAVESEDSDPELPIEVKPNPVGKVQVASKAQLGINRRTAPIPIAPLPPNTKNLTPYRLICVETNAHRVMSQPSLNLTFSDLASVKVLNLVTPLPPPPRSADFLDLTLPDGSRLGPEQSVLATTKDGVSVKLCLRRVVQNAPTSKLVASSVKVTEHASGATAGHNNAAGKDLAAGDASNVSSTEESQIKNPLTDAESVEGEDSKVDSALDALVQRKNYSCV